MGTEFTKGEWIADIRVGMVAVHLNDKEKFNCLDGAEGECIFIAHGHRMDDGDGRWHWEVTPEQIANAHLISAAPEMYEALKATIQSLATIAVEFGWSPSQSEVIGLGNKALAKAEGREDAN